VVPEGNEVTDEGTDIQAETNLLSPEIGRAAVLAAGYAISPFDGVFLDCFKLSHYTQGCQDDVFGVTGIRFLVGQWTTAVMASVNGMMLLRSYFIILRFWPAV